MADVLQTSLPDFDLPPYKGVKPQGMKTALTGAGNRISRAHTIGDRVVLVIEAKVKRAGHEDTDDGLLYTEQFKVVDMFEVDDPAAGRLLSQVREAYREADDERHGRMPLLEPDPPAPDPGWTDEAGTVMTPDEVAEATGTPGPVAGAEPGPGPSPARASVIVVFSDGARQLWPVEFEAGEACPSAGDRFEVEEGGFVHVAQVLDQDSGELLERWGEETSEDLPTSGEEPGLGEVAGSSPPEPDVEDVEDAQVVDAEVVDLNGPTTAEFEFVDRDAAEIKAAIGAVTDPAQALRLVKAEQAGRGRGLKPRKGVLEVLERHASRLGGTHPATQEPAEVPALPGEDADFAGEPF